MTDGALTALADDFLFFAESQCPGRSDMYARLSRRNARTPDILDLIASAPPAQRRPSLLFAAVQFLLLRRHRAEPLAVWFPAVSGAPLAGGDPWEVFAAFCRRYAAELREILRTGRTQTNEVRRTATLVLALEHLRPTVGARVAVLDLGASAGLNLLFDRFGFDLGGAVVGPGDSPVVIRPQVTGAAPEPADLPAVVWRCGVDLAPVDVVDDESCDWLRAFVWPEQHAERRLDAALALARERPPTVVAADALDGLGRIVDAVAPPTTLCVFHASLLTYLDRTQSAALARTIRSIVEKGAAVWVYLEPAGLIRGIGGPSAVTAAHCADRDTYVLGVVTGAEDTVLARVDTYGESIRWLA